MVQGSRFFSSSRWFSLSLSPCDTLLSPCDALLSLVLKPSLPSSWSMLAPVCPVPRFFFPSLGSCARGPVSGPLVETRTGGAAVPPVWWTCASGRGVPERVRRPRGRPEPGATTLTVVGEGLDDHQRGAGNLHGLVGLFGHPRPTVLKVYGPRLPPCLWGGLFLLFCYACCGAVSCEVNLPK